jgi:hypothetical protein
VRAAQKGDTKKEPTQLPEAKTRRVRRDTAASYVEWLMFVRAHVASFLDDSAIGGKKIASQHNPD